MSKDDNMAVSGVDFGLQNRFWKGKNRLQSWRENFRALLFATSRAKRYVISYFVLHFIWYSVLIKTKVVILASFVAHWRAPEAGRRNVWSLLGAAKFCRVAKLHPHWRCDLIDKFYQSLRLIKTDLSLVRIGPYSTRACWICDEYSQLGATRLVGYLSSHVQRAHGIVVKADLHGTTL